MEENAKVFSSEITRGQEPIQNNLYELINVQPARPTAVHGHTDDECEFQPKTGKVYVPKRRTKPVLKVFTVRDIRKLYESDVFPDLVKDLEKQQTYLLRKITCGSFRGEKTKSMAISMMKCDKPISRSCWQMLMNLNKHEQAHAIQYVLWNGRCIRVNGSKGGKNKFLCEYDLEKKIKIPKTEDRKNVSKKSVLLQNSLNIRFKPGPLTKKRSLDDSYQRYNVGKIDLVKIPKPGLNVYPKFGVPLEPSTMKFVHSLRDVNGAITDKWAEFSVSTLGVIKNKEVVQISDSTVTFELNYNYDQQRMLMRRDVDTCGIEDKCDYTITHIQQSSDSDITSEVETVLNKIIDAVEISLLQDDMYTGEDEPREQSITANAGEVHTAPKEKPKKRFLKKELYRLDVTVIRLPETPKDDVAACDKAHCSLGCICSSLQQSYNLKQHCGRLECMFQCKCDFSKYKAIDTFQNDCPGLIPGLINLDNELNFHLAKEEQKFHQTVVMAGEKSIVLKSEKRNWKATKRCRNFLNTLCLKSDIKQRELLAVMAVKLNLENVEPWCMVHNLYKCFCKGKFTHANDELVKEEVNETIIHGEKEDSTKDCPDFKDKIRTRTKRKSEKRNSDATNFINDSVETHDLDLLVERDFSISCARTRTYAGRKFYTDYYRHTNKKIQELEANDTKLHKKMMTILNRMGTNEERLNPCPDSSAISVLNDSNLESNDEISRYVVSVDQVSHLENNDANNRSENLSCSLMDSSSSDCPSISVATTSSEVDKFTADRSILNHTSNKQKLIAWLEASYKLYKQRADLGIVINSLEFPKPGKVAMHPWEFILTMYKERKNLFLITKEIPYRIFITIDAKDSFFRNCINIDEIRFAQLSKYPITVKNLLTNAKDLKDNLFMLCGLTCCWELVGPVNKIDRAITTDTQNSDSTKNTIIAINKSPKKAEIIESVKETDKQIVSSLNNTEDSATGISNTQSLRRSQRNISRKRKYGSEDETETEPNLNMLKSYENQLQMNVTSDAEQSSNKTVTLQEMPEFSYKDELTHTSKWFVMTVENDFSEIQFYKRGFFCKYESVINAINVARMSGKTVRLSSQQNNSDANGGPQFGIYAIPNSDEYYVFVGPYEKDEPLGIETVITYSDVIKTKRTRGVWILTQKIDNIKVIDNPLAFMPPEHAQPIKLVSDETGSQPNDLTPTPQKQSETRGPEQPASKDSAKVVKPIKIRKTNGFYQLASHGLLKPVIPKMYGPAKPAFTKRILQPVVLKNVESDQQVQKNRTIAPVSGLIAMNSTTSTCLTNRTSFAVTSVANAKPVAEIAPQIKIVDVYSESEAANKPRSVVHNLPERGMLVLKPEEINKRMIENRFNAEAPSKSDDPSTQGEDLDLDIENFLATSSVFVPPNADIFEISDEEDSEGTQNDWKPVFIECTNIKPLGYVRGRKRVDGCISFEFPGFKYTDFYEEREAFFKINQVFSRKVYVPTKIVLQWRIVDSFSQLQYKNKLKAEELGADFVLTKQGLRHKRLVLASVRRSVWDPAPSPSPSTSHDACLSAEDIDDAIEIMSDIDDQSKSLEEEGDALLSEMVRHTMAAAKDSNTLLTFREEDQATLRLISDSIDLDESSESDT